MSTLTTAQKAPLLDENGNVLPVNGFSATVSDLEIVGVTNVNETIYVYGKAEGTATVTAIRASDQASATLQVTVTPVPFSISLGTPEPL